MAKNEIKPQETAQEEVQENLTKAGQWIIENQNKIVACLTTIVVVVLGAMALHHYVFEPKATEAENENAKAVVYFLQGQYEQALNGDNADCMGFQAIADEYSRYQPGKLAALYAGVCYYNMGDYQSAVDYIEKFSADDVMIDPAAKMLSGDAYVELGELEKAVKAFKAAADSHNELVAPIALKKAGFVYLELGKNKDAKSVFETIKSEYPNSQEAKDIDKYIAVAAE